MTAPNLSENANIGGSSLGSMTQIDPIFSYPVKGGGDIYIYVVQSEVSKMAIACFDDTSSEVAYSIQTLTVGSKYEIDILLENARERFNDDENNPFHTLLWDTEALNELIRVIRSVVKGE